MKDTTGDPSAEPTWWRFHTWVDRKMVVAAVWLHPGGYYWCQSWSSPDLAAAALDAAAEWEVSPDSPAPADLWMGPVTWLRTVLPLGTRGSRHDTLVSTEDVPTDGPEQFTRQLVASGLDTPHLITTLSWPSLEVSAHLSEREPDIAAMLIQRLEDRAREASERGAQVQDLSVPGADAESPGPQAAFAERDAIAAAYADQVLDEDEFVAAILDGATQSHLYGWADAVLEAVIRLSPRGTRRVSSPLGDLMRHAVELRRQQLEPFAGYLEAPESIIRLYQEHRDSLRDVETHRNEAFAPFLRDVAEAYHRALGAPITWGSLVESGAWPVRPDPPAEEWY